METKKQLLHLLADAQIHSGESLAQSLGISRTAVWKQLKSFANYGLEISPVLGKGYRLSQPIEFYDKKRIEAAITGDSAGLLKKLEIFHEIGSTSHHLLEKIPRNSIHGRVVLAEFQSAGKGRRGASWISPLGSGICMSLGWRYEPQPASMASLSLAVGVAVAGALRKLGIDGAGLKWPNDIFFNGRKLGGILIETRGENEGPCDVVVGIGINMDLPEHVKQSIGRPVSDLAAAAGGVVSRNDATGVIIGEALRILKGFGVNGFLSCIERWRELDVGSGRDARLILTDKILNGTVLGIDQDGMLLMSINGETRKFSSGELSLRFSN